MEPVYRCLAGIDVHKKMLAVVVRREVNGQLAYVKQKFGTTRCEILHLAAWLQQFQVVEVVMESTAQYWRPVWYGLESHFQLHLVHPLKTRAPRRRSKGRQEYLESAPLAGSAGDLDRSAMGPRDSQNGCQPQPSSWKLRSKERIEYPASRVRVHSDAGIDHFERHEVSGRQFLRLVQDGRRSGYCGAQSGW